MIHIHWYGIVRDTGVHQYLGCRCGKRKIRQVRFGGYQPVDTHWLETGEWRAAPKVPLNSGASSG